MKILKSFEFRSAVGGAKHPWDEWLDGKIRQLDKEDFGETQPKYIVQQAHSRARDRGMQVHASIDKEAGTVTLQAYAASPEVKARWAEADAKAEAAKKAEKNGQTKKHPTPKK
jgi:hypothetical protein